MEEIKSKYYIVVPYDTLKEAAEIMVNEDGESNNSFQKMLDVSNEYIAAELTPIVLYDLRNRELYCIVKEYYGKKLH